MLFSNPLTFKSMNRLSLFSFLFLVAVPLSAQNRRQSFDSDWKFHRGPAMNAELSTFDDSSWRAVCAPHDYSMEPATDINDYRQKQSSWTDAVQIGPFSRMSIGDWDTGQTVGGEAWYRKDLTLPIGGNMSVHTYLEQKQVYLVFDGVYNQSELWINGRKAAMNVYGYMPYKVLLNPYFEDEATIKLALKTINSGLNSRWYAGSGMFRHVWVETTNKVHLNDWDVFVDASEVDLKKKTASVKVFAKVFNDGRQRFNGQFCVDILDANGNRVAQSIKDISVAGTVNDDYNPDGEQTDTELFIKNPQLWSVDNPTLYTARVYLTKFGEENDALFIPFGARKIEFSAKDGFKLNGVGMKLRGGCIHHDNGILGAAAIDRADIRRVQLLKAQGYNAIRCSHNLPSVAFLDACDSIGMLVIDEVFDQWEEAKRHDDYSNYFSKEKLQITIGKDGKSHITGMGITNFEYDAALMVRRDRNHPSVIVWSIGNEIAQRADVPRGKEIALAINLAINNYDGTRPTTLAVNSFWDRPKFKWETDSYRAFENVELGGYNYECAHYESDHEAFPDRIIYGSESYPKEMARNWNLINKHPYIIGDFVWTAVDYVGEAGLGHTFDRSDKNWIQFLSWPWFNSWCGDLDLIGDKKPQSYYRDVLWGRKRIAMAVRPAVREGEREDVNEWGWAAEECHWNWGGGYLPIELRPEHYQTTNAVGRVSHDMTTPYSDLMRVNVYSTEPRVRLLLNDSIIGDADVNMDTYTATFYVKYQPGTLTAQTLTSRAAAESVSYTTSGKPSRIILSADRTSISSDHSDLSYIYISIIDDEGNLCPTAECPLTITSSGDAEVIAGTAHPYDMRSFRSLTPTTFRGRALAILQPHGAKGQAYLTVKSPGLTSGNITIELK